MPSSPSSTGILPSGFCSRTLSFASDVSAASTFTSLSRPSKAIAIRILRPNGEAGDERSIIMETPSLEFQGDRAGDSAKESRSARAPHGLLQSRRRAPTRRAVQALAGNNEIYRLRTLTFLVRLNVEIDPLTFGQRFQARTFNSGDVHEHIAAAIIRLDEAIPAFAIEELDSTTHCHRATPYPVVAPPSRPLGTTASWTSIRAKKA